MAKAYFQKLFSDKARALQTKAGSRRSYALREAQSPDAKDELTEHEQSFIAARDSVYIGSVGPDGWPYIQHRGGPAGFIKVLGNNQLGFAEYPGNKQYISLGNFAERPRVSMFFMDYPAQRRLKLIGLARVVTGAESPELISKLFGNVQTNTDLGVIIDVVGFDWNCPKYIQPRWTKGQVLAEIQPVLDENAALREELALLKEQRR